MIGAIAGDIIGSPYESGGFKYYGFKLFSPDSVFTDDTVLTVAVADCILNSRDYAATFKTYAQRYPHAGYGSLFIDWMTSKSSRPYNSFGNGSAMRVSPVGFTFSTMEETLREAKRSAEVTHNHPEGIKGAQAVAAAIFLARKERSKVKIQDYIEKNFGYNLYQTLGEIRPNYKFDATCQGSVPQSIIAFLESNNYEDAVRKAVSLGGDTDTMACITGGIAQAYYQRIPDYIIQEVKMRLDKQLLNIVDSFNERFNLTNSTN